MESSATPADSHEAPQQLVSSRNTLGGAERSTDTTPRVSPIVQLPQADQDVNSDADRIDCALSIHVSSTDSKTGLTVGNSSAITNAHEARLAILRISEQFEVPITLRRQHVVFELPGQPPPLLNGPFTLESVGPDIRKIIFAFLLKNKDLGKPASATVDAMRGITRYELDPTILRTCKAFHDEGVRVLYEGQPYYIFCSTAKISYSISCISCPLIRYTRYDGDLRYTSLRSISAVKRVKQWVVVLDGKALRNHGARPLTEVCRALCDTPLNKLTICVVPPYWDGEVITWESGVAAAELERNNHKDIRTILAPLKMLRNLDSCDIEIRDAVSEEFFLPYVNANNKNRSLVGSLPRQNTYIPDIIRLIKGSTPVELGFKMFDLLLSYSQAFERQPALKAEMAPLGASNTYLSSSHRREGYHWPHFSGREDFENPFVNHPVERGLQSAEQFVWDAKDIKKFKKERRKILDYLEPQYHRISGASLNLEQFIKRTKRRGGFLEGNFPDDLRVITNIVSGLRPFHECLLPCHCDNDVMHIDMFTAVYLVREYAKSFERDMPIYVRADIMEQQRHFDDLFIDLPRDQMLSRLDRMLELKQFEGVHVLLRNIIDCIDDQLIEIREARKNLFDADVYPDQRGMYLPQRIDHPIHPSFSWHPKVPSIRSVRRFQVRAGVSHPEGR